MVELDYRSEADGWADNRWLAIHNVEGPMGLVLGALDSTTLAPPGTTLAAFFRQPQLREADEQPCGPSDDGMGCGEIQRLALAVSTELGEGNPVFDHGSWFADFLAFGYWIEVEQAWRHLPGGCDDVRASYFSLLVVWFPSD